MQTEHDKIYGKKVLRYFFQNMKLIDNLTSVEDGRIERIFACLRDIRRDATREKIDELLVTGNLPYDRSDLDLAMGIHAKVLEQDLKEGEVDKETLQFVRDPELAKRAYKTEEHTHA